MWTLRLRFFLALNLRDSTSEENVRKRPFPNKMIPQLAHVD